jgi:hypothetical protein
VESRAVRSSNQRLPAKQSADEQVDNLIRLSGKVTGVRTHEMADRIVVQVGEALVSPRPNGADDAIVKAYAATGELAPQNATEAMLATQMIAAHDAALMFLNRATLDGQAFEAIDANVARATRLMRLFSDQVEVMQKLKGQTVQQKVIVQHVHVNEGGQAIVGAVDARGRSGKVGDAAKK